MGFYLASTPDLNGYFRWFYFLSVQLLRVQNLQSIAGVGLLKLGQQRLLINLEPVFAGTARAQKPAPVRGKDRVARVVYHRQDLGEVRGRERFAIFAYSNNNQPNGPRPSSVRK